MGAVSSSICTYRDGAPMKLPLGLDGGGATSFSGYWAALVLLIVKVEIK